MALNDVFRLSVVGSNQGISELVNVHYYQQISAGAGVTGADLVEAWVAAALPSFLTTFSSACFVSGFEVRNMTQPEFGVDVAVDPIENGERTGQMLPPQNAPVISWRTGLIGRRRRGRSYGWPGSEDDQNAGQMNTAWQTSLALYAAAAIEVANLATYHKVIYSDQPDLDPPLLVTPVTNAVIDVILGSQRRRRPGVGS